MNLYRYALEEDVNNSTDFTIDIAVGESLTYQFRFVWATASQEQYNELLHTLTMLPDTDPIVKDKTYDRTYDWIAYYTQFKGMSAQAIEEWYVQQDYLPQSLRNKTASVYVALIRSRCTQALDYQSQVLIRQESMRWTFIASLEGETITGFVQPGGWYEFNTGHAFRFTAGSRDNVGLEEMQYVTVEFDIDE